MRIAWDDAAKQDFHAAIDFLEEQRPAGARRIGDRISGAVGLLERFPDLAPRSCHRGLRQLVVARTPYLVIYRVRDDLVEIRAIVHAEQRRRK
jgi:toxin ParE1/3/4